MTLPRKMNRAVGGKRIGLEGGASACVRRRIQAWCRMLMKAGRDARHHSSRRSRFAARFSRRFAAGCLALASTFAIAATAITPAMAVKIPESLPAGAKVVALEVAPTSVKLHGAYDSVQ